ncbi:hypothetical protein SUDANB95_07940 (plasmid) [Actinosynnema sp. ALI-1.44]
MTSRDDEAVVHALTGGATVEVTAEPETEAERTVPLRPMTPARVAATRWRLRVRRWWKRPGAAARAAVAVLVIAAVVVIVVLDRPRPGDQGQRGDTATAMTRADTTTSSSVPPPVHRRNRAAGVEDPAAVAPRPTSAEEIARLPVALVGSVIPDAPADPAPTAAPGTTVLHPVGETVVYVEPGGAAVARLPVTQVFTPTWVPVVDRRPGWVLVLLPSKPRPDGVAAAGWVHLSPQVELAEVDRRIEVDRATRTMAVSVLVELGATITSGSLTAAASPAAATGVRTFVVIGPDRTELPWLLGVLWPFMVSEQRLCTAPLAGITVPGLPADSPLGTPDQGGCVDTPRHLREALRAVPAGTPVVLR